MTDTTDSTPPFPGFPGFPPAEMLDRMWGMMRLSPFGAALTGAQPGGSASPSLSMMSDMMAPLTNVEELDKRITDMRAVEQWLKLNLSMLQSAIQALEVQRATLATLRAFGAFAQSSMAQPAPSAASEPASTPSPAYSWAKPAQPAAQPAAEAAPETESAAADSGEKEAPATPAFDASAWWNLLQSQFNQIAQFAMTQPGMAAAAAGGGTQGAMAASAESAAADSGAPNPSDVKPAARRPAAKRAPAASKRPVGESGSGTAPKKAS
ncbi:transcriptional regulator [Paraburkholderia sp. MMS20-SJTR3]|uniref:Transcriptional regulator n=1 Tax=Paraburkholderia sejongensis TaxID=2886946 RepID=A0ABS8JQW3_9BURK|nr:PhaM family polyhydroxyalkanoate granule multifunctional regulatory protein [Paraburkholderia sp. MMS20-SJTR3]MCC8392139.1 transcriptional regulator [Paraburkholderia sp. MMS20-SJTR3]